jgi:hypothetical protein
MAGSGYVGSKIRTHVSFVSRTLARVDVITRVTDDLREVGGDVEEPGPGVENAQRVRRRFGRLDGGDQPPVYFVSSCGYGEALAAAKAPNHASAETSLPAG